MNQQASDISKRKNKERHGKGPARKIGYIVVIIIMFVILYLVRHWDHWHLKFLTEDFSKVLFYIELSIYATIGANVLFVLYDNRWFKHLIQAITDVAGALSIIMFYVIYPLNIEHGSWDKWIKIGLLVIFGFTIISIIVNLVKGIRYLVREPEAI